MIRPSATTVTNPARRVVEVSDLLSVVSRRLLLCLNLKVDFPKIF